MISFFLSIILFIIFLILGGFHLYWLFGGLWGVKTVIPTKDNETTILSIPKFATLIVSLVLFSFGLIYLIKSELIIISLPNWIINYAYWAILAIFGLRAVGDFNYVGFFKKIKNTEFAKADSKLFAPLCLTIAFIGVLIQLMK